MIPILQRIRHSASTTARKFGTFASVATIEGPTLPNHHHFALPTPEPLTPQLLALGVDECSANRISSTLLRISLLLRRDFETGVQRLLQTQDHSSSVPSTFVTIYKRTIQQWTSYLLDDITPRVVRAQALRRSLSGPSVTESAERKRPFNVGAVPVLEQFFEQNAFPSRLEKFELASKCHMDFKQIHIWFQNRRTRLRKEGKEPKRSERNNALLQELEKTVMDALLPVDPEEHDDSDQPCGKPAGTLVAPGFDIVTPAHAFPSPYPPICSYDPFPEQARRSFELPWLRSVLPAQIPRGHVVDIDDLTIAFANLTISTGEPEKCEAPNASRPPSCTTYLTPCPVAPLAALVRSTCKGSPTSLAEPRIPSPRGDPRFGRTSHPVGSQPSPHRSVRKARQSVHSPRQCLSSSSNGLPSTPRCKRSLPRRVPRNLPSWSPYSLCQGSTFAASRQSSTVSQLSDSIMSGSDVDSPLSTPPDLPVSLPLVHDSMISASLPFHFAVSQAWLAGLQWELAPDDTSKHTQQPGLIVSRSLT